MNQLINYISWPTSLIYQIGGNRVDKGRCNSA